MSTLDKTEIATAFGLNLGKRLGEGSFGVVFDIPTHRVVKFSDTDDVSLENFIQEAKWQQTMSVAGVAPRVYPFPDGKLVHSAVVNGKTVGAFVMDGGDFDLHEYFDKFPNVDTSMWISKVIHLFSRLANKNILCHDLKAPNMVVQLVHDDRGEVTEVITDLLMIDFGNDFCQRTGMVLPMGVTKRTRHQFFKIVMLLLFCLNLTENYMDQAEDLRDAISTMIRRRYMSSKTVVDAAFRYIYTNEQAYDVYEHYANFTPQEAMEFLKSVYPFDNFEALMFLDNSSESEVDIGGDYEPDKSVFDSPDSNDLFTYQDTEDYFDGRNEPVHSIDALDQFLY